MIVKLDDYTIFSTKTLLIDGSIFLYWQKLLDTQMRYANFEFILYGKHLKNVLFCMVIKPFAPNWWEMFTFIILGFTKEILSQCRSSASNSRHKENYDASNNFSSLYSLCVHS